MRCEERLSVAFKLVLINYHVNILDFCSVQKITKGMEQIGQTIDMSRKIIESQ